MTESSDSEPFVFPDKKELSMIVMGPLFALLLVIAVLAFVTCIIAVELAVYYLAHKYVKNVYRRRRYITSMISGIITASLVAWGVMSLRGSHPMATTIILQAATLHTIILIAYLAIVAARTHAKSVTRAINAQFNL